MEGLAVTMAGALAGILFVLSLLHLFWLFGGRWGMSSVVPTVGGKAAFQPGPLATILVAAALVVAAGVVLWRGGLVDPGGPGWIPRVGIWVLVAVFGGRAVGDFRLVGFFKRVRGTRFARLDDRIFSPLCLLMAGLALGVAVAAR